MADNFNQDSFNESLMKEMNTHAQSNAKYKDDAQKFDDYNVMKQNTDAMTNSLSSGYDEIFSELQGRSYETQDQNVKDAQARGFTGGSGEAVASQKTNQQTSATVGKAVDNFETQAGSITAQEDADLNSFMGSLNDGDSLLTDTISSIFGELGDNTGSTISVNGGTGEASIALGGEEFNFKDIGEVEYAIKNATTSLYKLINPNQTDEQVNDLTNSIWDTLWEDINPKFGGKNATLTELMTGNDRHAGNILGDDVSKDYDKWAQENMDNDPFSTGY